MIKGLSKRAVLLDTGMNARHFDSLVDANVLSFLPNPSSPMRKKVDPKSLENLIEGVHYVKCLKCGSMQSQITTKHLTSCSDIALDVYQQEYPNAPLLSQLASDNKAKTEAQKQYQSRVLKARFQTPEGEETRKQISKASKALMQTDYRERAANHLRELNKSEEQIELLREKTTERWQEGGDLRQIVPKWHEDNKSLSNHLAAQARKHISKVSGIHLRLKDEMVKAGIEGFITEYEIRFYAIDEANPQLKIAVEVDGCYWHSCPVCGLEGPPENIALDKRKNSYLRNRGWTILRIWGHELRADIEECVSKIQNLIQERSE